MSGSYTPVLCEKEGDHKAPLFRETCEILSEMQSAAPLVQMLCTLADVYGVFPLLAT